MNYSIEDGLRSDTGPSNLFFRPSWQNFTPFDGSTITKSELIATNNKCRVLELKNSSDLFTDKRCFTVKRFNGGPQETQALISGALNERTTSYALINFNSDHLAGCVYAGSTRSILADWVKLHCPLLRDRTLDGLLYILSKKSK